VARLQHEAGWRARRRRRRAQFILQRRHGRLGGSWRGQACYGKQGQRGSGGLVQSHFLRSPK
jgi:hypothetical protein